MSKTTVSKKKNESNDCEIIKDLGFVFRIKFALETIFKYLAL